MLSESEKYEVYIFDKVLTSALVAGEPYCLIKKEHTYPNGGTDGKETSYFAPIDRNGVALMNMVVLAATNWWSNDAVFKDARLIGHIHAKTTYSAIEPLSQS
jgi:hypothetical protein